MKKELNLTKTQSVLDLLKQKPAQIAGVIAALLASDKKDLILSSGRIVQGVLSGQKLSQLGREIEEFRRKGMIDNNCFSNEKNRDTFYDLLKFIDEGALGEELFRAAKSIFFSTITADTKTKDEVLAYQMFQICKKLTGEDILILKASFDIVKNNGGKVSVGSQSPIPRGSSLEWAREVSKKIGHGILEIVRNREEHLENLNLIAQREQIPSHTRPQDAFLQTPYFRLTPLGYKFCEFITKYN